MQIYHTVLGIDRLPSYNDFAVVIISNSEIIFKKECVSKNELLEIAQQFKVNAIAIDNIYELGSESEIKAFMSYLYNVDLVQVTGSPIHGFKPLSLIARELGLSKGSKLSPMKSAEVCAMATIAGYGYLVKFYDPETKIVISRRRKFGSGGMSSERFKRSMEGAILNLTRIIENRLKSRGIDYDLLFRRGNYGLDGSTFIIYAPRNQISGIVRPLRTSSINVRVIPMFSKSFDFVPLNAPIANHKKRYLIVGIDPGIVCGIAILDLNGRVLHLSSGRNITRGQITRTIISLGRALVFASDVNPPPSMILKLAASHNAIIFYPESFLKVEEKSIIIEKIISEQNIKVKDSHQSDALAAALKAYLSYKNKLEQCISHVKELGAQVDLEEVKALVIRGMSIRDAIMTSKIPKVEKSVKIKKQRSEKERIKFLKSKLELMKLEREYLLAKVKELESKAEELEEELRLKKIEVKSIDKDEIDRRVSSYISEIGRLRAELEKEKNEKQLLKSYLTSLASRELMIFKKISSLREALELQNIIVKKIDEIDEDLRKILLKSPPKFIIVQESYIDDIFDFGIPVIMLSDLKYVEYEDFIIVDSASFNSALENAKKKLEEHQKERAKKIKHLFEEYRLERLKELKKA
ncbi:MAG: DUF460 domain-containing protein [Candidatus Methanomethyliaceae archaeon]|nr:DUF460 domain-containing protein [Candidatus Methanomethyliaceae archaeon]MDW7970943.1 DUF460 domain-containing protein [Nitrososphaerota archaeon]